jgi:hypothetical protein
LGDKFDESIKKVSVVLLLTGILSILNCLPSYAATDTEQSLKQPNFQLTIGQAESLLKDLLICEHLLLHISAI